MDGGHSDTEITTASAGPWGQAEPPGRHDGWTPERMATFCETLAATGLVVDACLAVGKSTNTAYAARRRNPLFAAAWEAALGIARNRLADALLARSIEGNVERVYKDGELIGERRVIDNRLGLAMLRRLDRLAETGSPLYSNPPAAVPTVPLPALDWEAMVDALRGHDPDKVGEALAALKAHEAHDPPNRPPSNDRDDDDDDDLPDPRVWRDGRQWRTDFPPPPGADANGGKDWGDQDYTRACTAAESAVLDARRRALLILDRADDAAAREKFFAALGEPAPAAPLEAEDAADADPA